jgi:hypothetical protein
MKKFFLIILFGASTISMSFAQTSLQKFEPPEGKTLLFIGQDNETIEHYISEAGCPLPAGFMLYTSIQEMSGLDARANDPDGGTMFADDLVKKYPNTALQIGLYMVDALGDIPRGKYDANIQKLAAWCAKTPVPIFLRIGYEFDGAHNHYDPQQYQIAYRYIVDKLRKAGADNVAFVWHAHGHLLNSPIQNWYPGDKYVDWVGISYFAQHPAIMKPTVNFAKEKNKPLMIAESTPYGNKTSAGESVWRAWYKRYFTFIEANNVKAVCYINSNWEELPVWKGWGDARIQANDFIKAKWRNETAKDRYLYSSGTLFGTMGYNGFMNHRKSKNEI